MDQWSSNNDTEYIHTNPLNEYDHLVLDLDRFLERFPFPNPRGEEFSIQRNGRSVLIEYRGGMSDSSISSISDEDLQVNVQEQEESADNPVEYDTESGDSVDSVETIVNELEVEPESDESEIYSLTVEPELEPVEDISFVESSEETPSEGNIINVDEQSTTPLVSESEEEIKGSPLKRKRIGSESPKSKRVKSDSDGDEDEGRVCPICFDYWTNSGEHRLCALKCGHLFGEKCVLRWLHSQVRKSCPTCKTKASVKDIRHLFAKKVLATDTVSIDNLKSELQKVKSECSGLRYDVTRLTTMNKNQQITIQQQLAKIYDLENTSVKAVAKDGCSEDADLCGRITFDRVIELSKEDSCRVMAYNSENLLVVTLKSPNQLFSGYGIRKVKVNDYSIAQFVPLHTKLIRDLAFHPQTGEWLLSVSLDKTAKLTNVANNTVLNTFVTEMPLWSCCWDSNDPNLFYVGGQKGFVLQFDVRYPSEPSKRLVTPNDTTSVIALVSVNSGSGVEFLPQGGLICCKLNSCWVFEPQGTEYVAKKINLEGPFVSLNYNKTWRQILISTRPNPRWVFCRHILCDLERADLASFNVKTIHYFQGGTTQTHLSRNCQIELTDDMLVLCYQETKRQINVWSVSTGNLVQTLPALDPVIDMCYVRIRHQLVALTEKRIRIYNVKG